jgi:hypothetical protein
MILAHFTRSEGIQHFDTVGLAKNGRTFDTSVTISPMEPRKAASSVPRRSSATSASASRLNSNCRRAKIVCSLPSTKASANGGPREG